MWVVSTDDNSNKRQKPFIWSMTAYMNRNWKKKKEKKKHVKPMCYKKSGRFNWLLAVVTKTALWKRVFGHGLRSAVLKYIM